MFKFLTTLGIGNKKKLVADIVLNLALASVGKSEFIKFISTEDADSIKCLGVTVKKFRDCFDVNFKNYFNVKIDDKMIMSGENVFRLMYAIYLDIDKKAKTSKKDFFKKNCNALFQKIFWTKI